MTTHEVRVVGSTVLKRYRPPTSGEPERELDALVLLAEYAPGLAPTPTGIMSAGGRQALKMSRVQGRPLVGAELTAAELAGVARAVDRLHDAVPAHVLDGRAVRVGGPAEVLAGVRERLLEPVGMDDAEVDAAIRACRRWLASFDSALLSDFPRRPVFTNADGNLSNYLWDGAECRIVDYEDAGVSDRSYEVADLLEHPTAVLTGAFSPESLVALLPSDDTSPADLMAYRRLFAAHWLTLLLPGGAAEHRNPPGSLQKQAVHVLRLLDP